MKKGKHIQIDKGQYDKALGKIMKAKKAITKSNVAISDAYYTSIKSELLRTRGKLILAKEQAEKGFIAVKDALDILDKAMAEEKTKANPEVEKRREEMASAMRVAKDSGIVIKQDLFAAKKLERMGYIRLESEGDAVRAHIGAQEHCIEWFWERIGSGAPIECVVEHERYVDHENYSLTICDVCDKKLSGQSGRG